MEKVRIGLIGLGLMGTPHARILKKVEECDLVAAADVDEKQKRVTEELGIKFYKNYEEMTDKEALQGVILALPNHLHAPIGIACAKKGLHLFVEKPIAQSVSEADRLIEAARQSKVSILVGHQRRFSSLVEKAREIITGGELGRLVGVNITWALMKPGSYYEGALSWRKEKGGGPILINLIHEIDNLRYICGEIDEVYAVVSNKVRNFPVEDTASITLRFRSGALGTIFLSDCTPSLTSWEGTTGENPLLYHDFGNCYNFFGTNASLLFPQMKRRYYSDPAKVGWNYPVTEQGYKIAREDPYIKEFSHFCRVIEGKEAPRISGEDGRRTLEVTLAIQKSGETGQPIRLG
jgi:predicted dehydrogenase